MRTRKMARTRSALIDAATTLCLSRGYDNTTVERIAEAADVSPRTFARYFPTKDAVFLAVLDDLGREVAAEIWQLPRELGAFEVLRVALTTVLARAHGQPLSALSAERIEGIAAVITSCATLRRTAVEYRSEPVMEAMADHMGLAPDHPDLALAMALIGVVIVHAWSTAAVGGGPLRPALLIEALDRAFDTTAMLAIPRTDRP